MSSSPSPPASLTPSSEHFSGRWAWLQLAVRPRWLALLLLVLLVAGVFAGLGKWQLERAITAAPAVSPHSQPLVQMIRPGEVISAAAMRQPLRASGTLVTADAIIVGERSQAGQPGYWVVAPLLVSDTSATVPVALGFTGSLQTAVAARRELTTVHTVLPEQNLLGQIYPDDAPPEQPLPAALFAAASGSTDYAVLKTLSGALLVNMWAPPGSAANGFYGGFLALSAPLELLPSGGGALDQLESIVPAPQEGSVNWLNMFYSLEWAAFAGFALYMWYRLVRDAHLRVLEAEAAEAAEPQIATETKRQ